MASSPALPFDYDPARVLVGDIDGDGAADLVYVGGGQVTLWINRSGNSWSDPVTIDGTPLVSDSDLLRLIDLFGNGVPGLLFSATDTATPSGRPASWYLEFTGGVKPYLLSRIDNHIGAITRLSVRLLDQLPPAGRPSAGHHLADHAAVPGPGAGQDREHRRDLRRPAHHHLPLPQRLLGRRRPRVPRLRPGRPDRHRDPGPARGRTAGRSRRAAAARRAPLVPAGADPHLVSSRPSRRRHRLGGTRLQQRVLARRPADPDPPARRQQLPRLASTQCPPGRHPHPARPGAATEVYGLDGTSRQDSPYTVTENVQGVSGLPGRRRMAACPAALAAARVLPRSAGRQDHPMGARQRPAHPGHLHRPLRRLRPARHADIRRRPARPRLHHRRSRPVRAVPGDLRQDRLCPATRRPGLHHRPDRPDHQLRGRQRRNLQPVGPACGDPQRDCAAQPLRADPDLLRRDSVHRPPARPARLLRGRRPHRDPRLRRRDPRPGLRLRQRPHQPARTAPVPASRRQQHRVDGGLPGRVPRRLPAARRILLEPGRRRPRRPSRLLRRCQPPAIRLPHRPGRR